MMMRRQRWQYIKRAFASVPRWFWCVSCFVVIYIVSINTLLTYGVNYVFSHRTDPVQAHVDRIELHLLRRSLVLYGARLVPVDSHAQASQPILSIARIEWRWSWLYILRAGLQGDLMVRSPRVRLDRTWLVAKDSKESTASTSQRKPEGKTGNALSQYRLTQEAWSCFVPFRVRTVDIQDIRVDYMDQATHPKISMRAGPLDLHVDNITNRYQKNGAHTAQARMKGQLPGGGTLAIALQFNPASKTPALQMQMRLGPLDMTAYNDLLRAYADLSLLQGRLALSADLNAKGGHYQGWARPVLENVEVKVRASSGEKRRWGNLMWRGLWAAAAAFLNLNNQESVLPQVEIVGDFENPELGLLDAVSTLCFQTVTQVLKPASVKGSAH